MGSGAQLQGMCCALTAPPPAPGGIVSLSIAKQILSETTLLQLGWVAKSAASKRDIDEQRTALGKRKDHLRASPLTRPCGEQDACVPVGRDGSVNGSCSHAHERAP